jgi:hypothetical protein
MSGPIITLTTDFGLSDHFVGTMKGVILGIEPRARLVDLSHEIAPYAIPEAAFVISQAYRFFPPKTVHLIVVDPGVGSERRPILAEAAGQYFVAPDNGVLSLIYAAEKHKVRAITAGQFFLRPVSRTFQGRDVFAPVAAQLAAGIPLARFGKLISDYVRGEFSEPVPSGQGVWIGQVLKIDRFGNLITNFPAAKFQPAEMRLGRRKVRRTVKSYAEGRAEELFAIAGSSGYLEIAMNQSSAAKATGCVAGAEVILTRQVGIPT